ncbi:MAG: F0F1 ATP synthase subunit A, partial [Myxococcaceae bacterium]
MRLWALTVAAVFAISGAAFAEGEEHGHSVPEYIFHHVTDDFAYEFEIPLNEGANPRVEFPRWRFAMPWGAKACQPATPEVRGDITEFFNGCLDMTLSKNAVMMFLASILLMLAVLSLSHKDRSKTLIPHGTGANLIEALVLFVRDELAVKNIGKDEADRYTPYLLSVFFFILSMNLLGLFPWMASATGNIAVTVSLAL